MAQKKRFMSPADKANSRARKEPRTAARKKKHREAQLERQLANKVNRSRGIASPWEVACTLRAARRRGITGAA